MNNNNKDIQLDNDAKKDALAPNPDLEKQLEIPENMKPVNESSIPEENKTGHLGVVVAVMGLIIIIIVFFFLHSTSSSSSSSSSYKPATGTSQNSQKCAVDGCDNLHIPGTGYYYCNKHTCAITGCKRRAVSGSKFCSLHKPSTYSNNNNYNNNSNNNNSNNNNNKPASYHNNTSTKTDPYNAKDYANEDDFWEDYYNDFIDFDEAEQYWDEYH